MIPKGYVIGTFITHDGTTPATGTVIIEARERTFLPDVVPLTMVIPRPVRIELVDGTFPPLGLVPTRYRVKFRVVGAAVPAFDIELTAAHTEANPLDLALAAPAPRIQ